MTDPGPGGGKKRSSFIRYVKAAFLPVRSVARRIADGDVILLSSALSFSILLTMIPLLLISASVLGTVAHSTAQGVDKLSPLLDAAFPVGPLAENIKGWITQILTDIITYRASLGVLGIIALIITTTFLFDIVRTVLHRAYRLPRTKGLLASFLHDVGLVAIVFLLLVASNGAIWMLSVVRRVIAGIPALADAAPNWVWSGIPVGVVFVMVFIMFYIVYGHITDTKPPRAAAIASTLTMSGLWFLSGRAFSWYLERYSVIDSVYGPYAFFLVLMLWVYYSSIVFVLGGIIGEIYWERLRASETAES